MTFDSDIQALGNFPDMARYIAQTLKDLVAQGAEVVLTFPIPATSDLGHNLFIADAAYEIVSIEEAHAGTSTGAATLTVTKCTGTQAPTAGTAMTSDTFDLQGTVNTVLSGSLSATAADYTLADGNRIGLKLSASSAGLDGGVVTIVMKRV